MGKVTYLLGAGASAGALPTIEGFESNLIEVITRLQYALRDLQNTSNSQYYADFVNAISDLEFLHRGCSQHKTVDTFAKMLFATSRDEEYRKAKCAIILFFELYQYYFRKIDKRYDAFFASIINRDEPRLPLDLNIISWNYDYEFEKAFMNYALSNPNQVDDIYKELNVVHKNSRNTTSLSSGFGIIKVNGTIGFYTADSLILGLGIRSHENMTFQDFVHYILNYKKFSTSEDYTPAISFAWEEDQEEKITQQLQSALFPCDALVVIGYSFPTFNRQIDASIISQVEERRVSIYIQDPNFYDIQHKIAQYFDFGSDANISEENNLSEFFIPHELTR